MLPLYFPAVILLIMKHIVMFIIYLTACWNTAHADEITLIDGRVLSGTILSEPEADTVRIKVIMGSMSIIMSLERNKISKLTYGKSAQEILLASYVEKKMSLKPDDSDGLWTLALKLKEMKNTLLFKQYARDVIAIDPQHQSAQRALGRVLHDGTWMSRRDRHIAMGKTFFEGNWLKQEAVDTIIVERESKRIAYLEKRAERTERKRARRRAQQFRDIPYRSPYGYDGYGAYGNNYNYGGISLRHNYPSYGAASHRHSPVHHGGLSLSGTHSWSNGSFSFNFGGH